jgi:beta-lactamase superfamily II metal-dependent hydrolase
MIDQARRFAGFLFILVLLLAARAGNVCAEKIIYYEPGDVFPIQGEAEQLEVHFIYVGAADCFLIRSGEHTMLVDSGTRSHSGAIIHYLESLDIRELSYMFATHPHDDHIGGFTGILTQVPVCELIWPELFDL